MNSKENHHREEGFEGTGTVHYIELEGGFFGIITDDEKKLLPLNLPDALKVDGIKISFIAKHAQVMTIQMWGIPVELLEVKVIKE